MRSRERKQRRRRRRSRERKQRRRRGRSRERKQRRRRLMGRPASIRRPTGGGFGLRPLAKSYSPNFSFATRCLSNAAECSSISWRASSARYRAETATCASIREGRSGLDGLRSGLNAQKARRNCAPAANLLPWQASHSVAPAAGGAGPPQVWQRMRSGGGVEPRGGVSGTGFSLNAASGARGGHARRCPWPRPDGESPGRQRGRDGGARASACGHVGAASLR
jgi:hypothetical protein